MSDQKPPQSLDNALIEVRLVMRRVNLLRCQSSKIASAKTVELDSLLVNNLVGAKAYASKQINILWGLAVLQGLFNVFLLWRMFK